MRTEFDIWLATLGQRRRDITNMVRGLPYEHFVRYKGNVISWGLAGTIKASPNATTELAVFTIGSPSYDAETDITTWLASLTAEQTAFSAVPDTAGTGRTDLIYDFLVSEAAGARPRRLMGGFIPISGFVTELA